MNMDVKIQRIQILGIIVVEEEEEEGEGRSAMPTESPPQEEHQTKMCFYFGLWDMTFLPPLILL